MLSDRKTDKLPDGSHCPVCESALKRVHRNALDRCASVFRSVHRYHCSNPACHWEGVLGRDIASASGAPSWRARALWFAVGVGFALAAVQGARMVLRAQSDSGAAALAGGTAQRAAATPPGDDLNGEPLPAQDQRVARNPSPLNLRRNCAWGVPGGNPYRGTVEQALSAAQLPAEVVRKISDMAARGWMKERVEISRTGIRTMDGRRYFGRSMAAMGFGNTLCFDTRVNFKPGHVEYAALYEADDSRGKTYSVMVPYVCDNVTLLVPTGEVVINGVAEPGSLASVLLGLGLLAGLMHWRRRAGRK